VEIIKENKEGKWSLLMTNGLGEHKKYPVNI
jgi:hypothetical protein